MTLTVQSGREQSCFRWLVVPRLPRLTLRIRIPDFSLARSVSPLLSLLLFLSLSSVHVPVLAATSPPMPVFRQLEHDFIIRRWDTGNGLPHTTARSLAQSSDGVLWVGTLNGVARLEGRSPAAHLSLKEVCDSPSEVCLSMLGDREGRLWIGAEDNLILHQHQEWRRFTKDLHWAGGNIESLAEDLQGQVYLGCVSGIYRVVRDQLEIVPSPPRSTNDISPWRLVCDLEGTVWARTDSIIAKRAQENWEIVDRAPEQGPRFNGLERAHAGGVWISSPDRLRRVYHQQIAEERLYPTDFRDPLVSLLEDRKGQLWAGGFLGGLVLFRNDGQVQRALVREGLTHSHITSLFEDPEGNIFVGGGAGGVVQLTPRRVEVFHGDRPESGESQITAIAPAADNSVVFLTQLGDILVMSNGVVNAVPLANQISAARSVCRTQDGAFWVGTEGQGLWHSGSNSWDREAVELIGSRQILTLFEDSRRVLYIGTDRGFLVFQDGRFTLHDLNYHTDLSTVNHFAEASSGEVYLASREVLFRIHPEHLEAIPLETALPAPPVSALCADAEGGLWIGFRSGGLIRFRPGQRAVTLNERNGLPAYTLSSLVRDGLGWLWASSSYGIVGLSENELCRAAEGSGKEIQPLLLDRHDGMLLDSARCQGDPGVARTPDGRLWFATVKGVAGFDPSQLSIITNQPPTIIGEILTEGKTYQSKESALTLPAGTKRLTVNFTSASLSVPERVRFRYRFDDAKDDWISVETSRALELSIAQPGDHHLQVRACNSDGLWNPTSAAVVLTVLPFFWQTAWFRILAFASFAILLGGTVWILQRSRLREQRQQLERDKLLLGERARSASVIEATSDLVMYADASRQVVYLNRAGRELLGISPHEDLRTMNALSILSPEDQLVWLERVQSAMLTKNLWGGGVTLVSRQGETIPATAVVIAHRNPDGSTHFYSAICRDLRELVKIESQKRAAEDTLRLVTENVSACFAYLDAELRPRWFNKSFSPVLGCETGPLVNQPLVPLLIAHGAPEIAAHLQRALEGNYVRFEWSGLSGEPGLYELSCVPHQDPTTRAPGILVSSIDITQHKREEHVRAQLENQLQQSQKMESLGTLAGGIAHDFNNILTAISGNTQLAISDLPENHPVQELLAQVRQSASRATSLVRQILTFSRQQEQQQDRLHLSSVIQEALKLLHLGMPATIQVTTKFDPNAPAIIADPTQLHQIIVNLGTNAAQAMRERGGQLKIEESVVELNDADLSAHPNLRPGRYLCLNVSDTGIGMDRATQDRIFDPFFTTKSLGEGTGLGLSVVHGIMQRLGGAITVESKPELGTTFRLYFPAVDGPVSASPAPAILPESGSGETILVVDDEEPVVFLTARVLKRLGYDPLGFTDPRKALAEFQRRPDAFAAVITDLSMPQMTGPDLVRQIRKLRPTLPAILTSGYIRPEDQRAAEDLGIRHLILKPNTLEEMSQTLREALSQTADTFDK